MTTEGCIRGHETSESMACYIKPQICHGHWNLCLLPSVTASLVCVRSFEQPSPIYTVGRGSFTSGSTPTPLPTTRSLVHPQPSLQPGSRPHPVHNIQIYRPQLHTITHRELPRWALVSARRAPQTNAAGHDASRDVLEGHTALSANARGPPSQVEPSMARPQANLTSTAPQILPPIPYSCRGERRTRAPIQYLCALRKQRLDPYPRRKGGGLRSIINTRGTPASTHAGACDLASLMRCYTTLPCGKRRRQTTSRVLPGWRLLTQGRNSIIR